MGSFSSKSNTCAELMPLTYRVNAPAQAVISTRAASSFPA
jgi:hypothetical protein